MIHQIVLKTQNTKISMIKKNLTQSLQGIIGHHENFLYT